MGSDVGDFVDDAVEVASWRSPWSLLIENKPVRKKVSKFFQRTGDLFSPEFPDQEFPEDEEERAVIDEDEARALALKRRSFERARRGRSSLRIDMPVRNPGVASGLGSGLRIPT